MMMMIYIYIYIYIAKLASNELFSASNKIHREVGRANLSAPQYNRVCSSPHQILQNDLSESVNEFPLAHYISDRPTLTNDLPQAGPTFQH